MEQEQVLCEGQIHWFGIQTADFHSSDLEFVLKYQLMDCTVSWLAWPISVSNLQQEHPGIVPNIGHSSISIQI